jgi:sugar fermentation stimulation protein A
MLLPPLISAAFLARLNRFAARVTVDGRELMAHVPNSGRLRELLVPGAACMVAPHPASATTRRTDCTLTLVHHNGDWVCLDTHITPRILAEAVETGGLPPFAGCHVALREAWYGSSRLDLALEGPAGTWLVETKCVTLVERGMALFPDAPTERGRRHMEELAGAVRNGHRAAAVFVVQR